MAIVDEPVRGSVPPPWFPALPGIDRMRALASGRVVRPPLYRLFGIQVGHVAPGSVTMTMPATAWSMNPAGVLDVQPFLEAALTGAVTTGLAAGMDIETRAIAVHHLRPLRPHAGNLQARARLVNASRLLAYAEVELEDARGRRVIHASAHAVPRVVEPPPPPPPAVLDPVAEPEYPTPDPVLRPAPPLDTPSTTEWQDAPFLTVQRHTDPDFRTGSGELLGVRITEVEERRVVATMPASEWASGLSRQVSAGMFLLLGSNVGALASVLPAPPGTTYAGTGAQGCTPGSVPADGRELRAEGVVSFSSGDTAVTDITIREAGGDIVSVGRGNGIYVRGALRQKRPRAEAKRVLATLLFVDVVDSTRHAERLGDARWRELLQEFRDLVREEIVRCEGTEIDTAGDGFFIRLESPASAIACARAVRDGVGRFGIAVRAGIHTGECEVEGGKPIGIAVHASARIQAAAAPGEILVSDTVRALATGSGLRFEDRGTHELKGVPDRWQLFAVGG